MTPAARTQAAIEILDGLNETAMPADRFIRSYFRARRYAGSKDRAAIAERVYDVYRHRASYAWRMQSDAPRALVIASLLKEEHDVTLLFDGSGYGPAQLTAAEHHAIHATPPDDMPFHVRHEFPEFLEAELKRSLGDQLSAEMDLMQARAPVDLRVNTLKATRNYVAELLNRDGFDAAPTPYSPWGLRISPREGLAQLQRYPAFENGLFEFQDEASQIAALLVGAKSGERILDLAAGAGGKSLALAASMHNEGEILAFDEISERLRPLPERANRAGARCITVAQEKGGAPWGDGRFDAVLLDAPCSGTGTWRRQPEFRWRMAPELLARLCATQDALLDDAASHVKSGGRLVYATCSLLRAENEDRIEAFLARRPDFVLARADQAWGDAPPPGMGEFFRASPATAGTDGFFVSILQKDAA
ncbi:MAG TPA: RsmB/NOP family class I SAM-dependent RNA methyltransferase [Rhizomicrobium sp.]|nr:RsmB/NOP family class I SAM-dependent RNA methyltransferase [Rhizomicrobium sp.]